MTYPIILEGEEGLDFLRLEKTDPKTGSEFGYNESLSKDKISIQIDGISREVAAQSVVVQCSNCQRIHLFTSWQGNNEKCFVCEKSKTNEVLNLEPVIGPPKIIYFNSSSENYFVEGSPITLSWRVDNVNDVFLNDEVVSSFGSREVKLSGQDTFILKAVNQRKFFRDYTDTQSIDLIPASPEILNFWINNNKLRENVPTEIRFKLRNASKWKLVIRNTNSNSEYTIFEEDVPTNNFTFEKTLNYIFDREGELCLTAINCSIKYPEYKKLYIPKIQFLKNLTGDSFIVTKGKKVQLRWEVENAKKIILSDGRNNYPVYGNMAYYEVALEEKINLYLTAEGDFNQTEKSDPWSLHIVSITDFRAYSNYHLEDPKFYLKWDGEMIGSYMLLPMGSLYLERQEGVDIPMSFEEVDYTLKAWPEKGNEDPIEKTITLYPARINKFELVETNAILGAEATLVWEVENARKISLLGVASDVTGRNSYTFKVGPEHKNVKLIVWGDINVVPLDKTIPIFKPPKLEYIRIPKMVLHLTLYFSPLKLNQISFAKLPRVKFNYRNNYTNIGRILSYTVMPSDFFFQLRTKYRQVKQINRKLLSDRNILNLIVNPIKKSTFEIRNKIRNQLNARKYGKYK